LLVDDKSLPDSNHDQALKGKWADYRQCRIKPDLLLIYSKRGNDTLRLPELARIPNYFDSTENTVRGPGRKR
jgi:addiction module RelE/StbE family toxin